MTWSLFFRRPRFPLPSFYGPFPSFSVSDRCPTWVPRFFRQMAFSSFLGDFYRPCSYQTPSCFPIAPNLIEFFRVRFPAFFFPFSRCSFAFALLVLLTSSLLPVYFFPFPLSFEFVLPPPVGLFNPLITFAIVATFHFSSLLKWKFFSPLHCLVSSPFSLPFRWSLCRLPQSPS